MVVALDLEGDREPLAQVDDARVLAGALEDALPAARQPLQEERGVLVPAVLGPEEREDRELEVVGLPAEQRPDALVLLVGQPESTMERLFRDAAQEGSLPGPSDRPTGSARRVCAALPGARDSLRECGATGP
jgi:hypothetical protein